MNRLVLVLFWESAPTHVQRKKKKKKSQASSCWLQLQLQSFKWNLGQGSYSCLPGLLLVSRSHHPTSNSFSLDPQWKQGSVVHVLSIFLLCLFFPLPAAFKAHCCDVLYFFMRSCPPIPLLCSILWLLFLYACSSRVSHYFPTVFCFHYSQFLYFLRSVCPTCCSPSPSLHPSWCLWWTCPPPRNILHSPPSISCLLELFSSSFSSFSHHQPLRCSLRSPRFVWSDPESSSFRSEMKSWGLLPQTGWERWPGRREPLPDDKKKPTLSFIYSHSPKESVEIVMLLFIMHIW